MCLEISAEMCGSRIQLRDDPGCIKILTFRESALVKKEFNYQMGV